MSVCARVKDIINERGLKQGIVAKKAGYSYQSFNAMLNGRKTITDLDISKICEALDVTPNLLFGFKNNPPA